MTKPIAAYEDSTIPWLDQTDGFCAALLFVDGRDGQAINETEWRDLEALAASRSTAAAIRADAVAATNSKIRAVEEYVLVFNSARKG